MLARTECAFLLADVAVATAAGGIVVSSDGGLAGMMGLCSIGGAIGGALAILIGREKLSTRELAKRWITNLFCAIGLGPIGTYVLADITKSFAVPVPILTLTSSVLCGVFGVGILIAAGAAYRSWIGSKLKPRPRNRSRLP